MPGAVKATKNEMASGAFATAAANATGLDVVVTSEWRTSDGSGASYLLLTLLPRRPQRHRLLPLTRRWNEAENVRGSEENQTQEEEGCSNQRPRVHFVRGTFDCSRRRSAVSRALGGRVGC